MQRFFRVSTLHTLCGSACGKRLRSLCAPGRFLSSVFLSPGLPPSLVVPLAFALRSLVLLRTSAGRVGNVATRHRRRIESVRLSSPFAVIIQQLRQTECRLTLLYHSAENGRYSSVLLQYGPSWISSHVPYAQANEVPHRSPSRLSTKPSRMPGACSVPGSPTISLGLPCT